MEEIRKELRLESITDFEPQGVVVDAGLFPSNPIALHWLDVCSKVVCCDGAANTFLCSGRVPWRIVGDCDSLDEEVKVKYASIVRRVTEQESNDQTKAVRYFASKNIDKIVILGATGLREDHTLGNISLLIEYLKQGIQARIYTDYGVFIPVRDSIMLKSRVGAQVSIFNFGATGLSASGLKYPIRDFDNWWQGTLNEVVSTEFTVNASGFFLIFLNY